jgi:hypothetical protein
MSLINLDKKEDQSLIFVNEFFCLCFLVIYEVAVLLLLSTIKAAEIARGGIRKEKASVSKAHTPARVPSLVSK